MRSRLTWARLVSIGLVPFAWVNTDDLNDGMNREGKFIKNDLHYSKARYDALGKRFAEEAIELTRTSPQR